MLDCYRHFQCIPTNAIKEKRNKYLINNRDLILKNRFYIYQFVEFHVMVIVLI